MNGSPSSSDSIGSISNFASSIVVFECLALDGMQLRGYFDI